jgi:group I intron endonuclease
LYGYIYKTTNLVNGKIYIGKRKGNFTKFYKGSGKHLKNAIKKYGVQNFLVEVIEYCDSLESQNIREKYWIAYYRSLNVPMYNIADGGDGGDLVTCLPEDEHIKFKNKISELNKLGIVGNKGKHLSESHKQKIGYGNKNKVHSDEWKKKQSLSMKGKPAWNKGLTVNDDRVKKYARKKGEFHHSKETKQLLSKKLVGRTIIFSNPEQRIRNMKQAQKNRVRSASELDRVRKIAVGRIWVNDGEKSKMIYPEELQGYLDKGFKKGRISWKNE